MTLVLDLKKAAAEGIVLDLKKIAPTATRLRFTARWTPNEFAKSSNESYDLDLSAFFLTNGKITSGQDVLFFNNQNVYGGAGALPEDNKEGGAEVMVIDLRKVPSSITQIDTFLNIFEAVARNQQFLMMSNATYEIANDETGEVIQTFGLIGYTTDNALHGASLVRDGSGSFVIKPVGVSATVADLNAVLKNYV